MQAKRAVRTTTMVDIGDRTRQWGFRDLGAWVTRRQSRPLPSDPLSHACRERGTTLGAARPRGRRGTGCLATAYHNLGTVPASRTCSKRLRNAARIPNGPRGTDASRTSGRRSRTLSLRIAHTNNRPCRRLRAPIAGPRRSSPEQDECRLRHTGRRSDALCPRPGLRHAVRDHRGSVPGRPGRIRPNHRVADELLVALPTLLLGASTQRNGTLTP